MKNINFKNYLPYAIAVALFAVLTLIYFAPITEGYELRQDDVDNYKGMAKEIQDYRKHFGEDPLWTNSMFGGMPAYQIDVEHNGNLLFYIDRVLQLGFPGVIGYFFLLFIGFYILLLCLKVDPWLGILGATAYAFSTYFILIVGVGHNTKVHALAYMPAVLGAFIVVLRGRMLLGAALFTLFFALELYSNHVQITYYLFLLMLCVGIAEFVRVITKTKDWKGFSLRVGILILGGTIGLIANSGNLWNTYEYGKDTTRGPSELHMGGDGLLANPDKGLDPGYITAWSYGVDETWNLIFPNAKGGAGGFIGNMEEFQQDASINNSVKRFVTDEVIKYQESQGQQGYVVNKYWGNQPGTGGPTYIGALVVFLFIISFVFVKDTMKWGVLAASVLAILLSWGHNFMPFTQFFIDMFPGYNKFRSVTMILTIVQLTMPLMAVLFVNELIKHPEEFKKQQKKFLQVSGITLGVLLLVIIAPRMFMDFLSNSDKEFFAAVPGSLGDQLASQIESFRVSYFRSDAFRSMFFILAGVALIYAFIKGYVNKNLVWVGLTLLVVIDLFLVDRVYLNNDKVKGNYISWQKKGTYPYMPSTADIDIFESESQLNPKILQDAQTYAAKLPTKGTDRDKQLAQLIEAVFPALNFNTNYRVLELGNPFNSSAASYFHKSVGGYHGAKLKRYQELIEYAIQREHNRLINTLSQMMQNGIPAEKLGAVYPMTGVSKQTPVLNMLNTRYIILNGQLPAIPNPDAAGQAWFASAIRFVDNADEEVQAVANVKVVGEEMRKVGKDSIPTKYAILQSTNHDIIDTVIVDKRFQNKISNASFQKDSSASINMTYYSPKQITYESNNSAPGFAVFSEIYYDKGWQAKIDGKPVDHVRVNYVLRGLEIPAGTHQIEFVFEPKSFKTMKMISAIGNYLLVLLVIALVYFDFKQRQAIADKHE